MGKAITFSSHINFSSDLKSNSLELSFWCRDRKLSALWKCLCQMDKRNKFILFLQNIIEKSEASTSAAAQHSTLLVMPKKQLLVGNILQPKSSKNVLGVL